MLTPFRIYAVSAPPPPNPIRTGSGWGSVPVRVRGVRLGGSRVGGGVGGCGSGSGGFGCLFFLGWAVCFFFLFIVGGDRKTKP